MADTGYTKTIMFRATPELRRDLVKLAETEGWNVADVVRAACELLLYGKQIDKPLATRRGRPLREAL
jgi:hypothetical protein